VYIEAQDWSGPNQTIIRTYQSEWETTLRDQLPTCSSVCPNRDHALHVIVLPIQDSPDGMVRWQGCLLIGKESHSTKTYRWIVPPTNLTNWGGKRSDEEQKQEIRRIRLGRKARYQLDWEGTWSCDARVALKGQRSHLTMISERHLWGNCWLGYRPYPRMENGGGDISGGHQGPRLDTGKLGGPSISTKVIIINSIFHIS
jgi:hypothetical protein